MSQNAVLDTSGDTPRKPSTGALAPDVRTTALSRELPVVTATPQPAAVVREPASVDAVRALAEMVRQPEVLAQLQAGRRSTRPFDAQYWACWLVALLLPVMAVYLWLTS